jgi:glyoxylase-like metal-dependent hydrolase (beta-lactamase superfamily II)
MRIDQLRPRLAIWMVLSLGITSPLASQETRSGPPDFRLVQVVPDVYATIEPREEALSPLVHGNSVFVVSEQGVFAVDANRTPAAAKRTIDLLRGVTTTPVRWLLVTHWHGDHWLGLQAFTETFPGMDVISTDTARRAMFPMLIEPFATRKPDHYTVIADRYDSIFNAGSDIAGRPLTPARRAMFEKVRTSFRHYYAVEAPHIKPTAPGVTFERSMRLYAGKRVIDLLFVGQGDTPGDAVAWLPSERVLAAGDMLVHPVPYAGSSTPTEWARSLRAVRALEPLHIIPGHGEVQHGTAYLDLVIETIEATIGSVQKSRSEGATLEQVQQTVTMPEHRSRFVDDDDPALADRWQDFLNGLIQNAFAEAAAKQDSGS